MASVHLGRVKGPMGFARTVAVKRLLPRLASDPVFTARFLDEARLAARVRHVNVVPTLDVVAEQDDLLIVMEYVAGLSLAGVLVHDTVGFGRAKAPRVPLPVVCAVMSDVLEGLHAAHTATSEAGTSLALVHRDVSPQNVLVGADGVARVIDFGVATASEGLALGKAPGDTHVAGKIGYMAPEQLRGEPVTYAADVYSASVMLWELLAHRRLMAGSAEEHAERVLIGDHEGPRKYSPEVPVAIESIVMQGLAASPARRFASAHEMAVSLQKVCPRASALEVASWLESVAGPSLSQRAKDVVRFESLPEGQLAHVRPSTLGLVAYDPTLTVTAPVAATAPPRSRGRRGTMLATSVVAASVVAAVAAVAAGIGVSGVRATSTEDAELARPSADPVSSAALAPPAPAEAQRDPDPTPSPPSMRRPEAPHRGAKAVGTGAARGLSSSITSCKVPFYFDADGMKHYRPECVR